MNINLNSNISVNRPAVADFEHLQEVDVAKADQFKAGGIYGPSLVVTESLPEVGDYVAEHLDERNPVRDDNLGKLVKSAFDLLPPEVPNFV